MLKLRSLLCSSWSVIHNLIFNLNYSFSIISSRWRFALFQFDSESSGDAEVESDEAGDDGSVRYTQLSRCK